MSKRWIIVFLALGVAALFLTAQGHATSTASPTPLSSASSKAQVLVLGVYHMNNPGRDMADPRAGNVRSPKRQAQIKKIVVLLKKFDPTKIAVEVKPSDPDLASNYTAYVAGKHNLSSSEIEQIGFRLAKKLGLSMLYGVDAPRNFAYKQVQQYAKKNKKVKMLKALTAKIKAQEQKISAYLGTHTVLQTLIHINSPTFVRRNVGFYFLTAHFSKPGDWAGADFLSTWFQRNARIYANIIHLIDSPHDRILVIYGVGHLGWLRHDLDSDPAIRLRTLAELVNQN